MSRLYRIHNTSIVLVLVFLMLVCTGCTDYQLRKTLDKYEALADKYSDFVEKYGKNPEYGTYPETEYMELMSDWAEVTANVENIDIDKLSEDDLLYFADVISRVSAKMGALESVNSQAEKTVSKQNASDETADNSLFGQALSEIITNNMLPDGSVANDLDGKVDGTYDKFAICDIDQDGKKELLISISSGSLASAEQVIYKVNAENTGLEYMRSFFTDAIFYDTGYVKENWSHNQGLAVNFWPYSIYQKGDDGYSEIGSIDAWEKTYMEYDFSGNPFPDGVDLNGNGIVYFIGDENGIDYDNPVDDAEYKEFEKKVLGDGEELYVPWQSLEMDSVKAATGIEYGEGSYDGDENAKYDRADSVYYIGDTVSITQSSLFGEKEYDITMTDWGTYVDPGNDTYVYMTFEVVNTGNEDVIISESDFVAYVNNYNVDTIWKEGSLGATLSPGRQTFGNVYIEMSPGDVNNLDVEFGEVVFRIQDNFYQNSGYFSEQVELSNFSYDNLFLYGGSYEGINQTVIRVNIYSSFDEGNVVGNVFLYDSAGNETFVTIRDDNEGEGIYTLCLDDFGTMYIRFYQDSNGEYYADIQGLDAIYANVNDTETYVMTEQLIP